ncbi:MAG: hypothetical protein AAF911_08545 [Planctomycetota bacterium]
MPALIPEVMREIEWLGVRLGVPADWEIVRHGISPRKGSLVFADRTRQRLQVTWTACTKRPDVARLLADHRAKQREQDPDLVVTTPVLPAGWRGMQRRQDDGHHTLTRAARYDVKASRLIEVVLDDEPDSDLIDDLLNRLVVTGPADEARRFCAFGLDVTIPAEYQLVGTDIQPADAALRFSSHRDAKEPEKHPTLTVRRRAMADVWFDGNLRRVLKPYAPRAVMNFDEEAEAILPSLAGGAGGACRATAAAPGFNADTHSPPTPPDNPSAYPLTATWNVPGPRYQRLLNLHRVALACAWHCPDENAVYEVVAIGPAKSPPTLEQLRVTCGQGGERR